MLQQVCADHADHNAEQQRRNRDQGYVAGVVNNGVFTRGNQRYIIRGLSQAQAAGVGKEPVRAAGSA